MILVIDRRDSTLSLEANSVVVRINDSRHNTVPIGLLTHVIVARKTALDSSLIARLADEGVMLTIFGGRHQEKAALVMGQKATLALTRRAQYRAAFDPAASRNICRVLIGIKTRAQQRMLRRMLDASPAQRYALTKATHTLANSRLTLRKAGSIDSIRGIEGANAAMVFDALKHVLPARLEFSKRQRRPPPDPTNALLSLTYTILHHTAVQCCLRVGLDPLCGYLHGPVHGRESLASDAIETLRPAAEEFVWRCFRSENLKPEHFRYQDGGCMLGKAGRGIYYGLVAAHRPYWEKQLSRHLRKLRRSMETNP